jgi:hypothetical protein
MTETELELARRLVAHRRWTWMAGMRVLASAGHNGKVRIISCDEWYTHECDTQKSEWTLPCCPDDSDEVSAADYAPDLSDPATQGCLWAMLRETGRRFEVWAEEWGTHCVTFGQPFPACRKANGDTLGEALARALLSVWGEE